MPLAQIGSVTGFCETLRYPVTDKHGRRFDKTVVYFLAESPTEQVRLSREHDQFMEAGIQHIVAEPVQRDQDSWLRCGEAFARIFVAQAAADREHVYRCAGRSC